MLSKTVSKHLFPVVLLCVLLLLSAAAPLHAAGRQKAAVVVMVANKANTAYDDELTHKMVGWVENKFNGVYDIKPPEPFTAKLRSAGSPDLDKANKDAVCDMFRAEGVDYVVYLELKPFEINSHVALFRYGKGVTAAILLRMLDVSGGQYLYDAIVAHKAAKDEQSVFLDERVIALFSVRSKSVALAALDKTLFYTGEIISVKLPLAPRPAE